MEELIKFLCTTSANAGWALSLGCLDRLSHIVKMTSLKKDEFLLREGQMCKNLYFIQSGLLKCYYFSDDTQVSDWFLGENECAVAVESFYDRIPSQDFIQALEDTDLFYITFDDLENLYRDFVEFNVIGRIFTNRYLRIWHRQARNIRMLTAEERYAFLLANQPELINRVSVRDLASYLDMSRETLSRMRGRIH
jgi:CRP/FNR family transcriptional regulator, anaerobic regulatory protein